MSERPGNRPYPPSATKLRALFREFGFRPRQSLGQTFLTDANIARKIVAQSGVQSSDAVVEVGPGAGAVTRFLAETARRVAAIEVDPRLVAMLREMVPEHVEILNDDVLHVDWPALLGSERAGEWKVVANLPYAITGPAILKLLEAKDWIDRLTIMVQLEVAERLVARPGSRSRGIITVLVEAACEAKLLFRVPRTAFWPPPNVDSAVVSLAVRRPALVPPELEPTFRHLVRAAFSTRRKMLANALAQSREVDLDRDHAHALLEASRIAPERRAESLSAEEFVCLTRAYAERAT